MIKKIILLFFISLTVNSCTKDDICSEGTPTTPFLIVSFKNIINPNVSKSVTNLTVSTIIDSDTIHLLQFETTDSIAIPLRTGFDFTDYLFVENDTDTIPGNTDKINFNYQTENVYINRACAFKSIYNQLSADRETDSDNWIDEITINKFTIEDENEAHITIFH